MLATELNWAEPNQNEQRSEDQSGAEHGSLLSVWCIFHSIHIVVARLQIQHTHICFHCLCFSIV